MKIYILSLILGIVLLFTALDGYSLIKQTSIQTAFTLWDPNYSVLFAEILLLN